MRLRRLVAAIGIAAATLAALLVTLTPSASRAEPDPTYITITPVVGLATFDDTQRYPADSLDDALHVGGRLEWRLSKVFGLEAAGGWTSTNEAVPGGADVSYLHLGGAFMIHPVSWKVGGPFFGLGGGYTSRSSDSAAADLNYATFELQGGWLAWLSERVALRLEARNILNMPKGDLNIANENEVLYLGGLAFALGGSSRDTDGDGVPDRRDRCPDTPMGATVDANGCPLDEDGDGVLSGLDQCPGTPGGAKVDARGCPTDEDGDGVYDGLDQCAATPKGATVDPSGCPNDSDGDKVWDGLDACPGTPKGALVDATGCPLDSDKDGVFDGIDKCPTTPANLRVDKDGCPLEVAEKETELLETGLIRLENVNFETAKAEILPDSRPVLDVVGNVLSRWPELKIEIGGHTDSRGSDAYNQELSQARAQAVLDYLTDNFADLKPEQLTAKGYGESRPFVANTSPLNMAKNRRVEFVVLNKETLKREVEKRRMLEKEE